MGSSDLKEPQLPSRCGKCRKKLAVRPMTHHYDVITGQPVKRVYLACPAAPDTGHTGYEIDGFLAANRAALRNALDDR